jgi:hypothetical protein
MATITEDKGIIECPKCNAKGKDVKKFDKDIYIVRNDNDFIRRKLYGCNNCKNIFTYDDTPRKESKDMGIGNIFGELAKKCEKVASSVSIKHY